MTVVKITRKAPIKDLTSNEDIEFAFKLIKWLFKPIGIWTLVSFENTPLDIALSHLSHLICFFIIPVLLIPAMIHITFVETDVKVAVMLFGPLGFIFGSVLKYICIICHKHNIKHCFKCIENDWRNNKSNPLFREIMINNAKVAHRMTSFSAIFMCFAGLSYHTILPLSQGELIIEEKNITIRPLVYPGAELFLDPQISPNYEIVFVTHCICALIAYIMTSAGFGIAAFVVLHISAQTQILCLKLNDFVEVHGGSKNICDIVDHHVKIMRFAKNCSRILREICFIEFLASSLITCLVEYYCITEWENSNAVGIIVYICILIFLNVNIFIFCYVGELLINEVKEETFFHRKSIGLVCLIDQTRRIYFGEVAIYICKKLSCWPFPLQQSARIGNVAFHTNWYKLPNKNVQELKMIIQRSMKLPKLTAGNIADLSISTFASILKTSLTYLNLLRSVTA